jgi:hypothetical protein
MNISIWRMIMPVIRKSADLCNSYGEISDFCHTYREEEITGSTELYKMIQEGIDDIENGRTLTEKEVLKNMEIALGK